MKEATNSYKSFKTILPYIGIKVEDYWHIDYKFRQHGHEFDYYWDLKRKYTDFNGKVDGEMIPLYLGSDGQDYYSSIFLGHYALGAYQKFLDDGCNDAKFNFLNVADWFEQNISNDGNWYNDYPMPTFNLFKSWQSCLSQAKGISTLARAFYITRDDKYYKAMMLASNSFFSSVQNGGVQVNKNGIILFEEYTTETPSSVLNGHIFALWSLMDILKASSYLDTDRHADYKSSIKSILSNSLVCLSQNLHLWDTGSWSRYDIWDKHYNIASLFYHDLHIKQLYILHQITGINEFDVFRRKWEAYRKNPFTRILSLFRKVIFRISK
ncbi:D-glucuronyl C5-epimerase family protein [Aeromonas dhakensis]|uniref:D-glucuronyl C5-epimerase family protein n=1 Tax=Aeromonas dhakensis TaxID=196024 RepID=UPI002B48783F|nr:D-glucuronyl C5-epimerase family protein [Aeromonas dhakensis]